jgi:hypothetical protein
MEEPMGTPHNPATFQLEIATDLVARFRREAVIRDMPVRALMLQPLDVIVSDKLIGAILDHDAPAPPPPRKLGRPKGSGTKLKSVVG